MRESRRACPFLGAKRLTWTRTRERALKAVCNRPRNWFPFYSLGEVCGDGEVLSSGSGERGRRPSAAVEPAWEPDPHPRGGGAGAATHTQGSGTCVHLRVLSSARPRGRATCSVLTTPLCALCCSSQELFAPAGGWHRRAFGERLENRSGNELNECGFAAQGPTGASPQFLGRTPTDGVSINSAPQVPKLMARGPLGSGL